MFQLFYVKLMKISYKYLPLTAPLASGSIRTLTSVGIVSFVPFQCYRWIDESC